MYKLLTFTFSVMLIFGLSGVDAYAQNSTDENQHHEIDKFEKERTIEIVKENEDTKNKVNISNELFVSNLSGVESITDSSLKTDEKLKAVDESSTQDPKMDKKKVDNNMSNFGVVVPNEFFESVNNGAGSNQAGAECSTVAVSY